MDDARVGNLLRAVRRRRGWRQADVARAAGIPQTAVSRAERGQLERLTLSTTRRIAAALEVALPFDPRWRGGETARLLDEVHANLVERCATILRRAGWEVIIEFTFSVYGERGAVDIVAWHPGTRTLLIVEVKSVILDLQALISTLDRKVRLVPKLLAEQRGWVADASAGSYMRRRRRGTGMWSAATRRPCASPTRCEGRTRVVGWCIRSGPWRLSGSPARPPTGHRHSERPHP